MSDEFMAANVEEIAEPQTDNVGSGTESEVQGSEVSTESAESKQDVTQTQAFAKRLKEEKQKAIDAEYSRLYGDQYGIHSKSDYDAYIERQKYIEEGKDPEVYQKLKSVETEMQALKREKTMIQQDKTLSNDQNLGEIYKEWRTEVHNIAEQYGVDLNAAFTVLCREKMPEMIKRYQQKQNVEQKNQQNASSSTGSVTGNGQVKDDFISFETFEANKNDRQWVVKNFSKISQSRAKW